MPDACSPLAPCQNLDGQLLLQRTIYGPQFGFASQGNLLGVGATGAGVRPYVDLNLKMTWRPVGLCQGPATSVMGLAPGEVVTVGIRTRSSRTFSDLISDAAESSQTSSHSNRFITQQGTQPAPAGSGGSAGDGSGGGGVGDFVDTVTKLAPALIFAFASILDDAISVAEDVASGAEGVASDIGSLASGAVSGLIDNGIVGGSGNGSSALVDTSSMTNDILDTVSRSESQSHLRQSTVTTSEETEQTIRRVFGNPYLDRSLQLRFIPVFNQFEIQVLLVQATPGLVTHFGEPGLAPAGAYLSRAGLSAQAAARPVASALYATDQVGDDDGLRRPMRDMLRSLGARGNSPTLLEHGLAWSRTELRGNGLHVPLASADNLASAWKLNSKQAAQLKGSLARIGPDQLAKIFQVQTRTVSIFAGTHIEAVPGDCILPGVPNDLKVIVPGATQYFRDKQ